MAIRSWMLLLVALAMFRMNTIPVVHGESEFPFRHPQRFCFIEHKSVMQSQQPQRRQRYDDDKKKNHGHFFQRQQPLQQHHPFVRGQQQQHGRRRSMISTTTALSMVIAKSGGTMISTAEQFAETVLSPQASKPVMVFYTAPWCGPCRLSIPVVQTIVKQYGQQQQTQQNQVLLSVVEVCTDDLADVAADCGVVSIPTIQFYHRGQLVDTIVGCVAKNVLAAAVDKFLEDVVATPSHSYNSKEDNNTAAATTTTTASTSKRDDDESK